MLIVGSTDVLGECNEVTSVLISTVDVRLKVGCGERAFAMTSLPRRDRDKSLGARYGRGILYSRCIWGEDLSPENIAMAINIFEYDRKKTHAYVSMYKYIHMFAYTK